MILVNLQNFTTNLITDLLTYIGNSLQWVRKYLKSLKYYIKELQAYLGALGNPQLMKLNQYIYPMEAHSYAKKNFHTSSIWSIILKHYSSLGQEKIEYTRP